jgi:hypothetical protein
MNQAGFLVLQEVEPGGRLMGSGRVTVRSRSLALTKRREGVLMGEEQCCSLENCGSVPLTHSEGAAPIPATGLAIYNLQVPMAS